mgnify:CR=1 FL=1
MQQPLAHLVQLVLVNLGALLGALHKRIADLQQQARAGGGGDGRLMSWAGEPLARRQVRASAATLLLRPRCPGCPAAAVCAVLTVRLAARSADFWQNSS